MANLSDIEAWLTARLPELIDEYQVPGAAVAVYARGEVIDHAAGVLSKATGVEATADSVFQVGSITKPWTTTLIMQLVDEGLVDIDKRVRDYLPDFALADESAAKTITLRQLLCHTGGFEGDIFTDTGKGDDCLEKYMPVLADVPQLFPPGERFSYNNAGFCVLGRIVEVLRGKPFDDCVREYLFTPLGLTHAANGPYEAIMYRAAVGHLRPEPNADPEPAPVWALVRSNAPAGSMLTMRPRDLLEFARMHMNSGQAPDGTSVLSAESVRAMREPQVDVRTEFQADAWGLGWIIFDATPGASIIGHNGGTIGQSAFLRILPERDVAVALLTNGEGTVRLYQDVVGHILAELAGIELPPFARPAGRSAADRREPVRRHILVPGQRPGGRSGSGRPDLADSHAERPTARGPAGRTLGTGRVRRRRIDHRGAGERPVHADRVRRRRRHGPGALPAHRPGQPALDGLIRSAYRRADWTGLDRIRERAMAAPDTARGALQVEANGINVIADAERRGTARQLFWPWFGANVSVLAISYGSFVLAFGISFWQAVIAGLIGIVGSFLLCGFIAVAGKRGSAPTMVLGRAAFGVRGNRVPSVVSWILTVGWETVLTVLATLATATVFGRLGWGGGTPTKIIALAVVAVLIVGGGVIGFNLIMRMQAVITVVTAVLTVVYIVFVIHRIHWHTVAAIPAGSAQNMIGALVFIMTGFGLGWVNAAADYSRYLPRTTSNRSVIGWTTFGSSLAPVVLLVFGLLLAGSSTSLNQAIAADPIGALATVLPTWYLVPFAIVAVLGLVGGAVLDIYSSGLALLTVGLRAPRYVAALIDGTIMVAGTIYVVFFAGNFLGQFEGFLTTLGTPIAAWCGIMLADILLRRRDYAEPDLYRTTGRYGDVRLLPVGVIVVGTAVGWGLVTNASAGWLTWQGYLLSAFGLGGKTGAWASANLGVLVALVLGFVVTLAFGRAAVRTQESLGA